MREGNEKKKKERKEKKEEEEWERKTTRCILRARRRPDRCSKIRDTNVTRYFACGGRGVTNEMNKININSRSSTLI